MCLALCCCVLCLFMYRECFFLIFPGNVFRMQHWWKAKPNKVNLTCRGSVYMGHCVTGILQNPGPTPTHTRWVEQKSDRWGGGNAQWWTTSWHHDRFNVCFHLKFDPLSPELLFCAMQKSSCSSHSSGTHRQDETPRVRAKVSRNEKRRQWKWSVSSKMDRLTFILQLRWSLRTATWHEQWN